MTNRGVVIPLRRGRERTTLVFRSPREDIQDLPNRSEARENDPESSPTFLPKTLFLGPKLRVTIPRRPDRRFQRFSWIPNPSKLLPTFERNLTFSSHQSWTRRSVAWSISARAPVSVVSEIPHEAQLSRSTLWSNRYAASGPSLRSVGMNCATPGCSLNCAVASSHFSSVEVPRKRHPEIFGVAVLSGE